MTFHPAVAVGLAQLALAIAWTAYAIYLPLLTAQAGIARGAVPWLLVMDQAVFALSDWASGTHADKLLAALRRLAPLLLVATALSTLAFVAMPWLAPVLGPAGFVLCSLIWIVTTAALRAPAMAMLGNFAPPDARAGFAATGLLGLGVAGAIAPYLALQLRDVDPRWPFAVAGAGVMFAAWALWQAERTSAARLSTATSLAPQPEPAPFNERALIPIAFLLALGFQAMILALPNQIGRVAPAEQFEYLMPVFWIGFCVALWPAAIVCRGAALRRAAAAAALVGAGAAVVATLTGAVASLVIAHLAAGAAWGVMLTALLAVAFARSADNRVGLAAGIVFGAIGAMAALRITALAMGWPKSPETAGLVTWIGPLAWCLGAIAVVALQRERAARAPVHP